MTYEEADGYVIFSGLKCWYLKKNIATVLDSRGTSQNKTIEILGTTDKVRHELLGWFPEEFFYAV